MKDNKGFTLIEIIIALTILSMVIGISFRSLSQIIRTKQIVDDQREISFAADAVINRIIKEFQLITKDNRLKEDDYRGYLKGEDDTLSNSLPGDSLTFMALDAGQFMPGGRTNVGIVQITYRPEEDPDADFASSDEKTFYLIRDEIPDILPEDKAAEERLTFPIVKNLTALDFKYYNLRLEKWEDQWRNENELPALIRVRFKLKSRKGQTFSFSTSIPIDIYNKQDKR